MDLDFELQDLEDLKQQINAKPSPYIEDRNRVWFITDKQRKSLNTLIDELESWRDGRIEVEEID